MSSVYDSVKSHDPGIHYERGFLLNQIEQMRSYRMFPLVGPSWLSSSADYLVRLEEE
jgi:hypothetical protein